MQCTLKWNNLNLQEWEEAFSDLTYSSLLQSYAYAQGVCRLKGQKARWALILIDNKRAGLVQILEAGILSNVLHAVVLDRGPLWFQGYGSLDHNRAFYKTLLQKFPRRLGRRFRILPEMEDNLAVRQVFQELGFKPATSPNYKTIMLDLKPDLETLRAGFKKNWRGALSKAQRSNLEIEWDDAGVHFEWLVNHYAVDRAQRGYPGPSVKLLRALAPYFSAQKNMLIARVKLENEPIAGILILCHGNTATYQVGWTSDVGRKVSAHHFLLNDALQILKGKGIHNFDLGGINDESAAGVKKFKEGLGGRTVELAGQYS